MKICKEKINFIKIIKYLLLLFIILLEIYIAFKVSYYNKFFEFYSTLPIFLLPYSIIVSSIIVILIIYKFAQFEDIVYLIEAVIISIIGSRLIIPMIVSYLYIQNLFDKAESFIVFWNTSLNMTARVIVEYVISIILMYFLLFWKVKNKWKLVSSIVISNFLICFGYIFNLI